MKHVKIFLLSSCFLWGLSACADNDKGDPKGQGGHDHQEDTQLGDVQDGLGDVELEDGALPEGPGDSQDEDVSQGEEGGDTARQDVGESEGDTAEPEGDTAEPEGDTAEPEADTAEPEADTAEPEGDTAEPEADAGEPEGDTTEPEEDTGGSVERTVVYPGFCDEATRGEGSYYGSLAYNLNDHSSACGLSTPGKDGFITVHVDAGATLRARYKHAEDGVLYLIQNCPVVSAPCLAAADDKISLAEEISWTNTGTTSAKVYLGLDSTSLSGDQGFELDIWFNF